MSARSQFSRIMEAASWQWLAKTALPLQATRDLVSRQVSARNRVTWQAMTLSTEFPKVFPMHDRLYIGLTGLGTDVLTVYVCACVSFNLDSMDFACLIPCGLYDFTRCVRVESNCFARLCTVRVSRGRLFLSYSPCRSQKLLYKTNMYKLTEEREIQPSKFAHLVSSTLYERRFGPYFVEPCIAGLETSKDGTVKPFICSTDLIGCINFAKDFVVCGTASSSLYGMCEALYEPDLNEKELFETISQCLVNAVDRDALSGWGAEITLITPKGVRKTTLRGRMD